MRKLLKHTGLKAVSSHVPLQQIRDDMQSVLDYHEELECGCIAVPYLAEEDRPGQPGFARVLETLYTFGRQCKNAASCCSITTTTLNLLRSAA